MNQNENKNLLFLRLAFFFSILGSGITWTGMGFMLASTYKDPSLMGLMQICSTLAGLVAPLIIGWISLKKSVQSILIFCDMISAFCFFLIFLSSYAFSSAAMNITSSVMFIFVSMLFGSIQSIYFEPTYAKYAAKEQSKLSREFANLGSYITLAKLIGMGTGPIIFDYLESFALAFNSATFLISAVLIYFGMKMAPKISNIQKEINSVSWLERIKFNVKLMSKSVFLEGTIASSLIFIVVLALSVKLLALGASGKEISIYWLTATACALCSQLIISKSEWLHKSLESFDVRFGYVACVPIFVSFFTSSIIGIIFCQMIFSFINPIARNIAKARFFNSFGDHHTAINAYATRDFISQLMILIFAFLSSFFYIGAIHDSCFYAISILIVLRWSFSKTKVIEKCATN